VNWPVVTLKDISKTQYGYTASASETEVGPKFLRITDIVRDQIDWDSVPYCEIDESQMDNYQLHQGDIVIARTGNTTGYAKLIRDDVKAIFASYLVRLKLDRSLADPAFVGRLIESDIYKTFVKTIKGGAAQGNANAKMLTLFKFRLPPIYTQQKIAYILSAYDSLIENNRRRIQLMEQSAQLLYREWFVHLRFPGHEHVRIIDGVPEGWTNTNLGSVLTLQRGFDLPLNLRKMGSVPIYASTGINGYHDVAKVKGPGVVTGRSGSLGTVIYIQSDFWPLNTTLWIKELRKISPIYSYHLLSRLNLEQYNGGVAVPTLNRNDVHRIEITIPPPNLIHLFTESVIPIYRQIEKLGKYNKKLTSARNILLPRLMNGAITV
jgi:type I restriction enzyme S subunit